MKIGIITYHAAYNFGSMLQAYATQATIEKLGHDAKIINYRMKSQKNFYKKYRVHYGKLNFLQDLCQIPMHSKKVKREKNYEKFLDDYFNLTEEFDSPDKMPEIAKEFDLLVSGSDQIWNRKSCEFVNCDINYMKPYLLAGFNGKKVSYASSIGHISDEDLLKISKYINKFDAVSVREALTLDRLDGIIDKKPYHVIDPTFLLNKDQWIYALNLQKEQSEKYILFYSLKRFNGNDMLKEMIAFAKSRKMKLYYIMPFSYYLSLDKDVVNCEEYGPREFLKAIYNAEMVVTDSYHGTILSINFEKDIYSICSEGGAEFRKTEVLRRIGLESRIITNISDLYKEKEDIDYSEVNKKIDIERKTSLQYITSSIGE